MLDWLLIGGGVHGTHLSLALTARLGWPRDRVRVLDPHAEPLARWTQQTANAGMAFMRSPLVHHLALDPYSLKRFARTPQARTVARFAPPYRRPAYALFQAHSDCTVRENRLEALRITGRACGLARIRGGWRVETEAGALDARRVVLCLGLGEQPHWPVWAHALRAAGGCVDHLFNAGFCRADVSQGERVAVIGGGISAVQAAVALAARGPAILISRHAARVHALDADPGWMGPKKLRDFHAEPCLARRRAAIAQARNRGSVPPDVLRGAHRAVRAGGLVRTTARVEAARVVAGGVYLQTRRPDGERASVGVDRVVLATGFAAHRPGGAWLDAAVEAEGLPVAPCGYPSLGASLQWAPGLYASGPLAELEVGAVARNIIGARLAAERLPGCARRAVRLAA